MYEEKVDGYRMLAYKVGGRVQLLSRPVVDHARGYPDVAGAIAALPVATAVLDGELAVFDQQLRSRFDWLRHRQPAEIATPPVLIAFDVLYLNGRERAGIAKGTDPASRVSFHTLRHTAASWLTIRGASLRSVQEVLGHATTAQTARYAHLGVAHIRADLERLAGLVKPEPGNGGATTHGVAQLPVVHA